MGFWAGFDQLQTLDAGLQAWIGAAEIGQGLGTVITPDALLARMQGVKARYDSLDALVKGSTKVTEAFRASWQTLKAAWDKFYVDNGPDHWLGRFFSAVALSNELDKYDEEYAQAFAEFRREDSAGAQAGIAPPSPDPESPQGRAAPSSTGQTIERVAIAAAVIFGLFGVAAVVKAVKA